MPGPLDGIVVADFSEYVAGPYATMLLADMGAEILKVEPYEGDHWRRHQPVEGRESRYFIGVNRGKQAISLRLDTPEGREIAHDLARTADVVIHNYRPGLAREFGIDYETLSELRPGLVYCSISAFGDEGPMAGKPGFDLLLQALSGIMDFERKVERGVPVGIATFAPADLSTGMMCAYAIVSALFNRQRTGQGTKIDTSLFGNALALQYRPLLSLEKLDAGNREMMLETVTAAREAGASYEDMLTFRTGLGFARAQSMYYRVYQTKDGLICVACLNNRQRRGMRDATGMEDPSVDGNVFALQQSVDPNAHMALMEAYEHAFRQKTTDEWMALLEAHDAPAVPVMLTEEVFDHPQVAANHLVRTMEHQVMGPIRQPAFPVQMEGYEVGKHEAAPAFSAHARAILRRIGYDEARIARLEEAGIVQPPPGETG